MDFDRDAVDPGAMAYIQQLEQQAQQAENQVEALQAQAQAMHADAQRQAHMQGQLQAQVTAAIQAQLKGHQSPTNHASQNKINKPEPFTGKQNEVRTFISKCQLNFRAQPGRFATEDAKVTFAASYMQGDAYRWLEAYLSTDPAAQPLWLRTWLLFAEKLVNTFGDPDEVRTAARKLHELHQTRSAATYAAEFRRLNSFLNWHDSELVYLFQKNLKPVLKDELAHHPLPQTLAELEALAIQLDNRIHVRDMERKTEDGTKTSKSQINPRNDKDRRRDQDNGRYTRDSFTNYSKAGPPPSNSSDGPRPMELDATRKTRIIPRGPLTDQEKDHRRKHNLCMYCGKAGHVFDRCSLRPQNRKATSANAVSFSVDQSENE